MKLAKEERRGLENQVLYMLEQLYFDSRVEAQTTTEADPELYSSPIKPEKWEIRIDDDGKRYKVV